MFDADIYEDGMAINSRSRVYASCYEAFMAHSYAMECVACEAIGYPDHGKDRGA